MKLTSVFAGLALALLGVSASHAIDFSYDPGSNSIMSSGGMEKGDNARLTSVLRQHPAANVLYVGVNVGGRFDEALAVSRTVHRHHMAVVAYSICDSACAYIWLAGDSRSVVDGQMPRIHVPGSALNWRTAPNLMYSFFAEMGLPKGLADYVIAKSDGANDELTTLTPGLLRQFGLSTGSTYGGHQYDRPRGYAPMGNNMTVITF